MFSCFDYLKDVGQVLSPIKFPMVSTGGFTYFPVAIERSFHIVQAKDLRVFSEGPIHNDPILLIASSRRHVFTATKSVLRSTYRQNLNYVEIQLSEPLTCLDNVDKYCMTACGKKLTIYEERELREITSFEAPKKITAILHPPTYLNKVLIAYDDNSCDLYNINSKSVVYTFAPLDAAIYAMRGTTVNDVVCFMCNDGTIVLRNIKYDKTLFALQHQHLVMDAAFREDGKAEVVVGLDNGDLIVWDLNTHQTVARMANAHNGKVVALHFLPGTNVFVSGGADNSIKQWVLDPDCSTYIRLFKFRVGHTTPPTAAAFCEVQGNVQLVTASSGRSIISMNPLIEKSAQMLSPDPLGTTQSQFPVKAIATTNSHRFCSCVTVHEDCSLAYLWDVENRRFAKRAVTAMPTNGVNCESDQGIPFNLVTAPNKATCATITRCGNFIIIGSDHGNVELFISQSARRRGSFEKAHDAPVKFVHVDAMNVRVVSGSEDGVIYFHNFDTRMFYNSLELSAPIKCLAEHPNGDLIAVGHGENEITIIDTATTKIARQFKGDAYNMAFSADGRFLFVAEKDPVVHLYDVITATHIQTVRVDSRVTQFAVHPDGILVATLHENRVATRLWNFVPSRITKAEGILAAVAHDDLIRYSSIPLEKTKKLVNPPQDPLRRPQAAKQLPFFLSALLDSKLAGGEDEEEKIEGFDKIDEDRPRTRFVTYLSDDAKKDDFQRSLATILKMDNEDILQEIAALGITDDEDERLLFAKMLLWGMKTKENFEAIQGLLSVFLKEHAYTTADSKEVRHVLAEILEVQQKVIQFLDDEASHALCLAQTINRAK